MIFPTGMRTAVDADRLEDDLRGLLRGDLHLDPATRGLYATDASPFRLVPLGVVAPRDEDDLAALVRYAGEQQIPLTARGAGTNRAGSALGAGIVVDFARYFRAIGAVTGDTVRVQPGVPLRRLADLLAADGRRALPDFDATGACTVGGVMASDRAGPRLAGHGYPHQWLVGCRWLLDTGEVVDLAGEPRRAADDRPERFRELHHGLVDRLDAVGDELADERPRTPFDRSGYRLYGVVNAEGVDYPRLLAGSEGTLGLFTELTLRTRPLPESRAAALFAFADLDAAVRAAGLIDPVPTACELLDRRVVSLIQSRHPELARLVPVPAEAVLVVEWESADEGGAADRAVEQIDRLYLSGGAAIHAVPGIMPDDRERVWAFREAALPCLGQLRGGPAAVNVVDDVGVPPERLPEFLAKVRELLRRFELTAAVIVQAATGQIELRPFVDMTLPDGAAKLWSLADELAELTTRLGGVIASRQGVGLARTPWVAKVRPRTAALYREIKNLFDPQGLFNPGPVVGPDPSRPAWPLREAIEPSWPNAALVWRPRELANELAACQGCGDCRTETPAARMCPVFRAVPSEEASPRAKVNLLRDLLAPGADPAKVGDDAVRAVAELCVNCKACARECPSKVNVPKLMLEAKAAHVAANGLGRTAGTLARIEGYAAWGSALAPFSNWLLARPAARWWAEKFLGIDRRRRLPAFARLPFLGRAKRWGWSRRPDDGGEKVAYFADLFANYFDPDIGEAVVRVLKHNKVSVVVPVKQYGSGMAPLVQGDVDAARDAARRNLNTFAELARDGYRIVCSEPTAAVMLRHDYLDLIDDADAVLVARQTIELTAYLWELHHRGRLRTDFRPVDLAVGHHVPCHVRALGGPVAGPRLLELIPRLRVTTIDVSCSGMAGTYGLAAKNFAASLAAGAPLMAELSRPRVVVGSTECGSCRMQMEHGSGKRTLHPVQYLALAYGLMPDTSRRLRQPAGMDVL